ncbi:hypothetical protein TNCV_1309081 [Trichonephila clavipes]|nr:hypothetical protein TNCV_1309081 [Trichonephila clavipes]
MDSQLGDHSCGHSSRFITDRSVFNGVISDEPGRMNGETSFFQMNIGPVYNTKMVASVFGGIVVKAHWQRAFVIVILALRLSRWRISAIVTEKGGRSGQ